MKDKYGVKILFENLIYATEISLSKNLYHGLDFFKKEIIDFYNKNLAEFQLAFSNNLFNKSKIEDKEYTFFAELILQEALKKGLEHYVKTFAKIYTKGLENNDYVKHSDLYLKTLDIDFKTYKKEVIIPKIIINNDKKLSKIVNKIFGDFIKSKYLSNKTYLVSKIKNIELFNIN